MVKIGLVTKNRLFGQSLLRFFEGEMAGSTFDYYNSPEDLLNLKKSFDVVVFELMPDFQRFQLFRDLVENNPDMKILVITGAINHEVYRLLINNGVKGCLSDNSDLHELLNAIREVSTGKIYFPYDVLKQIIMLNQPETEKQIAGLTDREIEILQLLCEGLSNDEISEKLHLSYDTVKWHRNKILIKCECKNILSLYKFAQKHKFLQT